MIHRRLDIIFKPCNPEMITDENRKFVDEKCLADLNDTTSLENRLKKSQKYLGNSEIKLIYNS